MVEQSLLCENDELFWELSQKLRLPVAGWGEATRRVINNYGCWVRVPGAGCGVSGVGWKVGSERQPPPQDFVPQLSAHVG
jgi:hypothetical protein